MWSMPMGHTLANLPMLGLLGLEDHGWLSWVIRLIGVHLFRFWLYTGGVRREAAPLPGHSVGIPPLGFSCSCAAVNVARPGSRAHISVRYRDEMAQFRERPRSS
jgi:hypothetical protein